MRWFGYFGCIVEIQDTEIINPSTNNIPDTITKLLLLAPYYTRRKIRVVRTVKSLEGKSRVGWQYE